MKTRDIIVVGASAGGFDALKTLAAGFPPDLPAAVFVVWHMAPDVEGVLPRVLGGAGPLPAAHAVDGEGIERGRITIAPPDRHLLLEDGRVRTLEEVGERFGVTRERIRQLETKALAKLRHPNNSRRLEGFLEEG